MVSCGSTSTVRLNRDSTTSAAYMLNRYYMQEMQGHPKNISCNAGDVDCVIDANGDVSFCELLKPVGNLKAYNWDFNQLWHDFQATQLSPGCRSSCGSPRDASRPKTFIFSPWRLV